MERAAELFNAAAFFSQHRAAVQTRVYIGMNVILSGASAHHYQRVVDNVVNDMVSDIRNVFQTTSPLPGFTPNLLDLLVVIVFRKIAFDRNVVIAPY